jgi:hypothetical protein
MLQSLHEDHVSHAASLQTSILQALVLQGAVCSLTNGSQAFPPLSGDTAIDRVRTISPPSQVTVQAL